MQLQQAAQPCSGVPCPEVRPPPYPGVPPSLHLWLTTATKSCWRPCHLYRLIACLHALLRARSCMYFYSQCSQDTPQACVKAPSLRSTLHFIMVNGMLLTSHWESANKGCSCAVRLWVNSIVGTAGSLCSLLTLLNTFAATRCYMGSGGSTVRSGTMPSVILGLTFAKVFSWVQL